MEINPDRVIPGHAHARITRFVDDLPDTVLCEVDPVANLCRVNARVYEHLPRHQQREVYRATTTILVEARTPRRPGNPSENPSGGPSGGGANDDTAFATAL